MWWVLGVSVVGLAVAGVVAWAYLTYKLNR
jgi:hypothetical protein